jgi:hypothetical protein
MKLQIPSKFSTTQIPMGTAVLDIEALGFPWGLVVGIWDVQLSLLWLLQSFCLIE